MKKGIFLIVMLSLVNCQTQSIFRTFSADTPGKSERLTFYLDSTYRYLFVGQENKIVSYGKIKEIDKNIYHLYSTLDPINVPLTVEEKYTGKDSVTFVFKDKYKPFSKYNLYFNINGIKYNITNNEMKLAVYIFPSSTLRYGTNEGATAIICRAPCCGYNP